MIRCEALTSKCSDSTTALQVPISRGAPVTSCPLTPDGQIQKRTGGACCCAAPRPACSVTASRPLIDGQRQKNGACGQTQIRLVTACIRCSHVRLSRYSILNRRYRSATDRKNPPEGAGGSRRRQRPPPREGAHRASKPRGRGGARVAGPEPRRAPCWARAGEAAFPRLRGPCARPRRSLGPSSSKRKRRGNFLNDQCLCILSSRRHERRF